MKPSRLRPGLARRALLVLALSNPLGVAGPPGDHHLPKSRSRCFEIAYRTNETALPLTHVELWYTRDGGDTWHNYGQDNDRQSPVQFDAAEEGLYGFYFVLKNHLGSSGEPPQPGSVPQQWAFVDYTPPIVQLHPVQAVQRDPSRGRVHIRWTAIDAHFPARPIGLAYRLAPDGAWTEIGDRLANTGRYEWHPPDDLEGRVVVRLTAQDRGGHRVSAAARALELARYVSPAVHEGESADGAGRADALDPAVRAQAEALFRRGLMHKERGEYKLAAARFQDALALDPGMPDALVNLGTTLYFQEQYEDSIEAFSWAVRLEPSWAEARRGLVRSLMVVGRYDDASEQLAHILQNAPEHAEAWLTLGDVAMSRGDELMARKNWEKAATVDPVATETIERARARLDSLKRARALAGSSRK